MKKFLYPGSFDPMTYGHLDIIKRASRLCDTLVVGIVTNSSKRPLFSVEERKMLIKEALTEIGVQNIEIVDFSGLLADYLSENNIACIVRGLRDTTDFASEKPRAFMNKHLYKDFETMFLISDLEHSYLSSSAIKEIMYFNPDNIRGLVPENVFKYIIDNNKGVNK